MILNKEKGVSLIITFFITVIILLVVLSISIILYSEVKVMRNVGNATISYYAGESGIEKVLYYDRQAIPAGAQRGLCSIFASTSCPSSGSGDSSIYCTQTPNSKDCNGSALDTTDCNPNTCAECSISFSTTLNTGKTYCLTAGVKPGTFLDVTAGGSFGGTSRKIEIITPTQ